MQTIKNAEVRVDTNTETLQITEENGKSEKEITYLLKSEEEQEELDLSDRLHVVEFLKIIFITMLLPFLLIDGSLETNPKEFFSEYLLCLAFVAVILLPLLCVLLFFISKFMKRVYAAEKWFLFIPAACLIMAPLLLGSGFLNGDGTKPPEEIQTEHEYHDTDGSNYGSYNNGSSGDGNDYISSVPAEDPQEETEEYYEVGVSDVVVTPYGKKYHRPSCYHLDGTDPNDLIYYTLEEAEANGYGPCSHCTPDFDF